MKACAHLCEEGRMGVCQSVLKGTDGKRHLQGGRMRTHSEEEGGNGTKLCVVIHRRANYNSFQKGNLS